MVNYIGSDNIFNIEVNGAFAILIANAIMLKHDCAQLANKKIREA